MSRKVGKGGACGQKGREEGSRKEWCVEMREYVWVLVVEMVVGHVCNCVCV